MRISLTYLLPTSTAALYEVIFGEPMSLSRICVVAELALRKRQSKLCHYRSKVRL